MTISPDLPDDVERRLREAAVRLNVPVAELAAAVARDRLPEPAVDFDAAARRVLAKYDDLYRRLA